MRSTGILITVSLLASIALGCGVNELPTYRDQIQTAQVSSMVNSSGEVVFATPARDRADEPEEVAVRMMETRIRERLAERLDRLVGPGDIEQQIEEQVAERFSVVLPWSLGRPGESGDASFRIELTRYGVEVDDQGIATTFYEFRIRGYLGATGELIYDDTLLSRSTLRGLYQSHGGELSEAAARSLNLMLLDEISDGEFHALVLQHGSQDAAAEVLQQLYEAAWAE